VRYLDEPAIREHFRRKDAGTWDCLFFNTRETVWNNIPYGAMLDQQILAASLRASVFILPRSWWRRALLRIGVWFLKKGSA
jgi:hypothetical protein